MLYAMETQDTRTDEAKSTLKFLEVCSEKTQNEFEANEVEDRPVPLTNNGPRTILLNDKNM